MTTRQQKLHGGRQLLRVTTFIIISFLLLAAMTLAILSILNVIPVPVWLSTTLAITFSFFGILIGFFQWFVPSSPVKGSSNPSDSLAEHTRQADIDSPDFLKDFFISYNSADRSWAEWIASQLELAGYTTVLQNQDWNNRPGANFVLEMNKAIKEARRTIVLLSSNYLNAPLTAAEWGVALAQDPTGKQGKVLPIIVGEYKDQPAGILGPMVSLDLTGKSEAEARELLLVGVSKSREMPKAVPFPGTADHSASDISFPGKN